MVLVLSVLVFKINELGLIFLIFFIFLKGRADCWQISGYSGVNFEAGI